MSWYGNQKYGPLGEEISALRHHLAQAAQHVYDQWEQIDGMDEVNGSGGICDEVAQAMAGVIVGSIQCEVTEGGQDGDDHASLIVYRGNEAYEVDIPANVYETGGGYNWQKIPDVQILPQHVLIFPIDLPEGFEENMNRFAAKGNSRKGPLQGRLGRCYELAGRYVSSKPGAILVHGHIFNPFNRNGDGKGFGDIDHAWVEEGGRIFDPVMDKWWAKDVYYGLFSVQEYARYEYEQVLKMTLQNRHWGPWQEATVSERPWQTAVGNRVEDQIAQKKNPASVPSAASVNEGVKNELV